HLANGRLDSAREGAWRLLVDRHVPPAEQRLSLLPDDLLDEGDARLLLLGLDREEDHSDAVAPGGGESDPLRRALAAEERVGHLDEDAGTVAGQGVATAGATMGQVLEDGERLLDDVVRVLALDVHHQAAAARVAFGARIEEWLPHATLSLPAGGLRSGASAWRVPRGPARGRAVRAARARCAAGRTAQD